MVKDSLFKERNHSLVSFCWGQGFEPLHTNSESGPYLISVPNRNAWYSTKERNRKVFVWVHLLVYSTYWTERRKKQEGRNIRYCYCAKQNTERKEPQPAMEKITQMMKYRYAIIQYALKHGVSEAAADITRHAAISTFG